METSKSKKKWRTFYLTLALAIVVCIAVYLLAFYGAITVEWMSVAMMAAICLLPARSLTSAALNWACEVSMSISEPIQKWLRPILVIKNLDPEKEGSHLNHEVIATAEKMIWFVYLLMALFFSAFPGVSKSRARVLIATVTGIWQDIWTRSLVLLVFLILEATSMGYLVFSIRAIYQDWVKARNGNAPSFSWGMRMVCVVILWAIQKLFGYFALGFTFTLVAQDIAFWLAIGLIGATVYIIWTVINKHSHSRGN